MKSLDELDKNEIIILLNKCWMTHDGMWFYSCLQELGIEKTNKLNREAIKSLAPIEMNRVKKILGIEKKKIENIGEFKDFFKGASDLIIPDFMGGVFIFKDDNILHVSMKPGQCFAYKGMKMMGVIEQYECGVFFRLECWFDSLGLKYTFTPREKKCLMHYNDKCYRDYVFHFE